MKSNLAKTVEGLITSFHDRCETASLLGITEKEVFEGDLDLKDTHYFDWETQYWIPNGVLLDCGNA
ncbi:MAG: hypothetical protein AAF292_16320 [Pseudomonadota bacterium]